MTREPLKGREHYKAWRAIGTRWGDNDMYGHVNNTVHYQWFDTAVNAWLIEAGLLGGEGGPIGLVVETGCRYARPLAYPEAVDVGLAIERIGNSSVSYALGVFAKDASEAAAEGRFVHVYVDPATRRPVPLRPEWRRALATIQA